LRVAEPGGPSTEVGGSVTTTGAAKVGAWVGMTVGATVGALVGSCKRVKQINEMRFHTSDSTKENQEHPG
jgi:hypothetical protein